MASDSRAIIMCGISGSGKTRYSRILESQGYVRISADELIWEEYGEDFTSLAPEQRKAAFMAANTKIMSLARNLLMQGKSIVVDATMCKRVNRDAISAVCRQAGSDAHFVYLQVPFDILAKRLSERIGSGPNDQIVPVEQLKQFYANFERPQDDEDFETIEF